MLHSPFYTIYYLVIAGLWLGFIVYWSLSAVGAKKTLARKGRPVGVPLRIGVIVVMILLFRTSFFRHLLRQYRSIAINPAVMVIGLGLCITGLSFAIWARLHLGKNWGMPMSVKEKPELVTSGPYKYVRHPIYTGMICAALGSALVTGLPWLIAFIVVCVYFTYSAIQEEKLLAAQFPEAYPAYKERTKMLIPFIF